MEIEKKKVSKNEEKSILANSWYTIVSTEDTC